MQALIGRYYQAAGQPDFEHVPVTDLNRACDGQAYILAGERADSLSLWTNDLHRFRRQFARYELANTLGIPEKFNWRDNPFREKMRETYETLKFCRQLSKDKRVSTL